MRRLIFLVLMAFPIFSFGQSVERQVIGSAGAFSEAGDFMLSSTVGESAIATFSEGSGSDVIILTQGFQQADDFGLSVEEPYLKLYAVLFPNPTGDGVTLDIATETTLTLRIALFDATGAEYGLPQSNLQVTGSSRHYVDMRNLASGTYFLQLTDNSNNLNKTIKILKTE